MVGTPFPMVLFCGDFATFQMYVFHRIFHVRTAVRVWVWGLVGFVFGAFLAGLGFREAGGSLR